MTTETHLDDGLEPLTVEALRWIVRLTSGSATQADAQEFERWRSQGPAFEAAFREAAAFRRTVRAMELPPPRELSRSVLPFRAGALRLNRRAVLVGGGGAIAASIAAGLVTAPPLGLWPSLADLTADQRTDAGERRRFAPTAGVAVELNGRSAMSLTDHGRGVRLIDGEAYVAVTSPRAEPFTIVAGDGRFYTRTGSLNVSTSARRTCVTCLTGAVEASGRSRLSLRAGQQATSQPDGGWRVASIDPGIAEAWRRGILIFHKTPLADAVEALNRYRDGKIIIASRVVAERPVDGVFHTDQGHHAVEQIRQLLHVKVTRLPGNVALIG